MRRLLIAVATTAAMVSFAAAQTATTTTTATTTDIFVTAKPTDVLSYNLIDLNVTDPENNTIGEIKDLIISDGQLAGYIVSVGGFLGIGERFVIVAPNAVQINYVEADKKWSATMNATKDQLEKATEFKYEGRWEK